MRTLFSILIVSLLSLFASHPVLAGPPFVTDDPEPVEYRHWEVYLASQWEFNRDETAGTAPHLEVNYASSPMFKSISLLPSSMPRSRMSHLTMATGTLR